MTREEAIEVYNGLINAKIKEAFEFFVPELRESEDERIRKFICSIIDNLEPKDFVGVKKMNVLAWLEKQKESDKSTDKDGDFTIYHPLKNGEGRYECIPYSFYGSLTSFSDDKDLMDFLNESFYDKEECERWCERENIPDLPECKHKIKKDSVFDYLCDNEKQKEQKPAEWGEEDEKMLNEVLDSVIYAFYDQGKEGEIEDDPAFLWPHRLRPSWKPSEEQMEALKKVAYNLVGTGTETDIHLVQLYEQLKKLM